MLYFLKSKFYFWRCLPASPFTLLLFVNFCCIGNLFSQQTDVVDFVKIKAFVGVIQPENKIASQYTVTFKILKKVDSVYVDAVATDIVRNFTEDFTIAATETKIWFTGNFEPGKTYIARFDYEVFPKQALYFFKDQIWTQGQGKYTSHWLPSIDDINDKIEFDLSFDSKLFQAVISNGKLISTETEWNEKFSSFNMKHPMPSYLAAFVIGNFDKKELVSNSGIPIELYLKPQDSLKFEPTYRYSKEIFDFLETEIGVPFPWQNYKQVPVRDFLYAGMENTTLTIFSEAFVVDSTGFNDRNYVNVNAHELAHQWFGNLVTETDSKHHWLQEGFATYYALLAEREIFGDEYYYWQLYQTAEQLKARSDKGEGESLLNPKASSLTFYQKGAWALHILRETIGDEAFKTAVKNYLETHKFKNVTTYDFLKEVKAVSNADVATFEKDWLRQSAFQSEEAYQSLMKSAFIQEYFEVSSLRATPFSDKKNRLKTALTFPNDFIGQEAVLQLVGEPISKTIPLYKKAFESNNLYVRQAIALSLQTIPKELQKEYESLLNDASYVTIETALYKLWSQFPEKRKEYLNKTKGIEGFQNKNIRQLWLTLVLITEGFENSQKESYLKELKSYTATEYSFEIREKAFEYVNELQLWDLETLKNLVEACVHPNWRFSKASKEMLHTLLQDKKYYEQVRVLGRQVSEKAANYINSILKQ